MAPSMRVERPAYRPGARGVEVRNFLLRGEAGHVAAVRPGLEPSAVLIESRVTLRLLGDSEGLAQLFVCGGGELRGIFKCISRDSI